MHYDFFQMDLINKYALSGDHSLATFCCYHKRFDLVTLFARQLRHCLRDNCAIVLPMFLNAIEHCSDLFSPIEQEPRSTEAGSIIIQREETGS